MKTVSEQDFLQIILDMMDKKPLTAGQALYLLGKKYGVKIPITEEETIALHEMDLLNSKSFNEIANVKLSLNKRQEENLPKFEKWWKAYPSRGSGKVKGVKGTAKTRFLALSNAEIDDLIKATELLKTKYVPDQPWFYQQAQVFISNGYTGIIDSEGSDSSDGKRNEDNGSGFFVV